jgi:hypothetical protein
MPALPEVSGFATDADSDGAASPAAGKTGDAVEIQDGAAYASALVSEAHVR